MEEVSVQAWSAVWRMPTSGGNVLIKQATEARHREGQALAFGAACEPEVVDQPLAVDAATGRILLSAGGPTLYESDHDHRGVHLETITALLADYARLQQSTVGREREAAEAGISFWDCADATPVALELAERLHDLPVADPRHLPADGMRLVRAARSDLDRAAGRLASSSVPFCLDHGDLWPGNALPPGPGRRRYRLIDFGDAAWTHPFLSMIMMITECRYAGRCPTFPTP